jgi:hypothetical protein
MRHILLPSMAGPSMQYFSTLSHKRHRLKNPITECKREVLIFRAAFVRNISHSKNTEPDMTKNLF